MKSAAKQYVQDWTDSFHEAVQAWKTFWFEPADAYLLGMIRLLTGWMLVYNLLVWSIDLHAFFGPDGLQPLQTILDFHQYDYVFSFWFYVPEPWITTAHWTCVGIATLFFLGVGTRVTSVLAYLITISYSQRVPVANFGLDQILGMLCLYLAIGPSGACLSVDNWWRRRKARARGLTYRTPKLPTARMAMRLIQLHMCVIYFWAGVSKLKGDSWYTGEAMWQVLANQEYQTLDLTWLAWMPWVPYLISHVTVLWEMLFCVLVWVPKLRSLMLLMGAFMHFGIGAFLGMWTFGLIMTYAYFAFSDPAVWRARLGWVAASGRRVLGLAPHEADQPESGGWWDQTLSPAETNEAVVVAATAPAMATSLAPSLEAEPEPTMAQAFVASEPAMNSIKPTHEQPASEAETLPQPVEQVPAESIPASEPADALVAETTLSDSPPSVPPTLQQTLSRPEAAPESTPSQSPQLPLTAGGVAAFSSNPAATSLQPLINREPLEPPSVPDQPSIAHINTPIIPRQTFSGQTSQNSGSGDAESLNPESALLVVALNKAERNTLRCFFRKHDVLCRVAATTSNVLTLAVKIKPVAVVVAGTQLSTENLITLLEDLEDVCPAPTLALVSDVQARQLTMLGFSTRLLTYPMGPGQIHEELKYMLFGDAAPSSAESTTATQHTE